MKALHVLGAIGLLGLVGCSRSTQTDVKSSTHGRYAGVGLYPAGPMWSQILTGAGAKDAAASKLTDDEEVIVAIDQTTGDIRQCGNLSGVCVGMNPWTKDLASGAQAPVALAKHAESLTLDKKAVGPPDALGGRHE